MLHDVIVSCLSLSGKGISFKKFLVSNVVDEFVHPCERSIFDDIICTLNYLNEIVRFAKYFGDNNSNDVSDFKEAEEYSNGSYLKNFAKGIEIALEEYYSEIARLESYYQKNSTNSLLYIHNALETQKPVILILRKLIIDARTQKLHGCGLLQNLRNQQHDQVNERMNHIFSKITKPIKLVFYSHLAHWLLLGMIDDPHNEFFISYKHSNENATKTSSEKSMTSRTYMSSVSEEDIWQYEINMAQLPLFVSTILAEKVLFVGQTVLLFKVDRRRHRSESWTAKTHGSYCDDVSELWDGKESVFSKMIEDLNDENRIDVIRFESVINDIKKFVSQRLSDIAVIEDNLVHQMCLIKHFYLLGRGEFYLEFLRQMRIGAKGFSNKNAKSYTRAFEIAANEMGIVDELENFTLSVQKHSNDFEDSCEFGIWQNLNLKYNYKWPLNLLFSPTTMERYNNVFRHLLIIRKLQYDLQLVWARHKWVAKTGARVDVKIMNFRNHLTFFLDNLQYYIQVDVLESQFSILINVIKNKADFEEIRRAHSIFLANVLSQCFLLNDLIDKKKNNQTTMQSQNPVYGTILEIFSICEKFSLLDSIEEDTLKQVVTLEEKFHVSILGLINLLASIKSASSFGPLSQFLLRLDYNHWFSADKTIKSAA
ncbi:gamma-tubulin complex component 4 homolog [Drosophila nasuta]|uniref:gamma-tubulin complex component 4 homolog n=1 Tax=Drosophila nasuta TaxID=42062 RepID=UPI00295F3531|nr:gamma-tubulin complex component 4 homolog [Drosophila nasuta]